MKYALVVSTGAINLSGGIAAVNRMVVGALNDYGFSVEIFSLTEQVIPGPPYNYYCFAGNKTKFTWAVWSKIFSKNYDLVIVDHVNLASILAPLSFLKKCNYNVWLFGIEVFPPKPDYLGYLGMTGARRCIAISSYTCENVKARYPKLNIVTCELCLEPRKMGLDQESFRIKELSDCTYQSVDGAERKIADQLILHVGRMVSGHREKGQRVLIEAFSIITKYFPNAQLMLVGQGEAYHGLFELARALPLTLQGRIFMPGYLPDELLSMVYKSCYLFAMPSIGEGFGLVYLEAMAHSIPCLGANCDATPGLIHEGVTGVLVQNPRSPEEVAMKIMDLLADPPKAQQLGQAGLELVNSNYLFLHFKERFARALDLT